MSAQYMKFYQMVVSPIDKTRSSDLIQIMLKENIDEEIERYCSKPDSTVCDLTLRETVFKNCIHYTNGAWYVLKSDSTQCRLESTGVVEHTFFLNLLRKDIYSFANEYVRACNDSVIPFELKIDEEKGTINIYATNETLLVTNDIILEIINKNPKLQMFNPPLLAGAITPYLGYVNEAHNRGNKPSNEITTELRKNLEKAFLEALNSLYITHEHLEVNLSGNKVKWRNILAHDITRKIYDRYYPINENQRSLLDSIYAPQYFGVSGEHYLDEQFLVKLYTFINEKIDDLFKKGADIQLPNSIHPILKPSEIREIMVQNPIPNSPISLCNTRVLNIPFEKAISKYCEKLDSDKTCFKAETKSVFEKLDRAINGEEVDSIRSIDSDEYIYYAFLIHNNKNVLVNFKGKNITFGDYFVKYVASYVSGHTADNYLALYDLLKDKLDLLLDDIRNYGSGKEPFLLSGEDIEFIIRKISVVIASIFPGKEYKQRNAAVLH